MQTLNHSLTNLQLEILNIFRRNLSDDDLINIKNLLSSYFYEKATKEADKIWEEKKWTDEDAKRIINSHLRTPYKSKKS